LVAAGKGTRRQFLICRTNIERFDDFGGANAYGLIVQKNSGKGDHRLAVMHAEYGIFAETELKQQPATVAVLGNVCNAKFTPRTRVSIGNVAILQANLARKLRSGNQPGKRFDQLRLTVTLHSRDPQNLALAHCK